MLFKLLGEVSTGAGIVVTSVRLEDSSGVCVDVDFEIGVSLMSSTVGSVIVFTRSSKEAVVYSSWGVALRRGDHR